MAVVTGDCRMNTALLLWLTWNHASCDHGLLRGPCLRVLQAQPSQSSTWQDKITLAKDAALWRSAAGHPGAASQLPPIAGQYMDT